MNKQLIITISREFGSGGHDIAAGLAERLGINMYDRKMLDAMSEKLNMDVEQLQKYDERHKNIFATRRVGKHSNSMEDILAEMQFEYIREKADSGESFIIVGRCANSLLSGRDGLLRFFIIGDTEHKVERVMKKYSIDRKQALEKMKRHDKTRKWYHNRYADFKWGDSRYYDLCLNSYMGVERTNDFLEYYVKKYLEHRSDI